MLLVPGWCSTRNRAGFMLDPTEAGCTRLRHQCMCRLRRLWPLTSSWTFVCFDCNFALSDLAKGPAGQHVSSRAFNCCPHSSAGGDLWGDTRLAVLPNKKEAAAFLPEAGRSRGRSMSCAKRRPVPPAPAAPAAGERIQGGRVSNTAAPCRACTNLWAAAGCEATDGELWRRVAAAVATDAEGAVGLPGAGLWLWMGKGRRRKKRPLHGFVAEKERASGSACFANLAAVSRCRFLPKAKLRPSPCCRWPLIQVCVSWWGCRRSAAASSPFLSV